MFLQVISLGDKIKFSLSPSKSKDRLSTNVAGVPLDERNLVKEKANMVILILINFNDLVGVFMILPLSLQIIKALNLYRKKTGTDNYFWVKSLNW